MTIKSAVPQYTPAPVPEDLAQVFGSLACIPGNIQVCDADGMINYANPQSLAALNIPAEEMIGRSLISFWDQPEATSRQTLAQLKKDGFWQGKIRYRTPDGANRPPGWDGWEFVALTMPMDENGCQPYIIKTGHPVHISSKSRVQDKDRERIDSRENIAELEKTRRALEESKELYHAMLEASPNSIAISRLSDSRYVLVNEAFLWNTGYCEEEVIGKKVTELNFFETSADLERFIEIFQTMGRVDNMELGFRKKDGSTTVSLAFARQVRYGGEPCVMVMTADIMLIKKAQQALMEREANYRTILEMAPFTVVITKVSDMTYVDVNPACCRRTGYSREEMIGRTPFELNLYENPEDRDLLLEAIQRDGMISNMEVNFRAKDGTRLESLLSGAPIQYQGEDCLLAMGVDITRQKQVQRELEEREASYRTVLETAPYSIAINAVDDRKYIEINEAFSSRSGFSREEVIGCTPEELNMYEDPAMHQRMLDALQPDGRVSGLQMNFRMKDGTIRETMLSTSPIQYRGKMCLLTVMVDISTLKQTQRALQEREENYRRILDHAPYSISIICRKDSRYMEVNNAFCSRTGYHREEVIGRSTLELQIYKDARDRAEILEALQRDGKVEGMELVTRAKDGHFIENFISITPVTYQGEKALLVMTVDITRQKTVERALRRSEQKYRNVLMNMEEGYWETDLEGTFTFVNEAEGRIHRCRPEDMIGMSNRHYSSGKTARRALEIFSKIYRTGHPAIITDYEIIRSDGTAAFLEFSASLMRDEGGTPIGFYGIARDVTEKKAAEDQLERYREHLEQMVKERTEALKTAQEELLKREKLSVLGQLTATVSHELRNPLGVIRSSNFFLHRRVQSDDEKIEKHFKRIEEQVNLCDLIVADLLEYTRGRSSTIEIRQMVPWIKELVVQMEESETVRIETRLAENLPPVPHDQEKIRRVLVNLIENAVQAVQARQETMEKEGRRYAPQVRLAIRQQGDMVVIEVTDNGVGMDAETCNRAFEPLFTTRARGTGIGLANVQKIVMEHGGKVWLTSEPGNGTCVTVALPCHAGQDGF